MLFILWGVIIDPYGVQEYEFIGKICSKRPARGWRSNVATISSNEPKEAASSPLRSTREEMNSGAKKS